MLPILLCSSFPEMLHALRQENLGNGIIRTITSIDNSHGQLSSGHGQLSCLLIWTWTTEFSFNMQVIKKWVHIDVQLQNIQYNHTSPCMHGMHRKY